MQRDVEEPASASSAGLGASAGSTGSTGSTGFAAEDAEASSAGLGASAGSTGSTGFAAEADSEASDAPEVPMPGVAEWVACFPGDNIQQFFAVERWMLPFIPMMLEVIKDTFHETKNRLQFHQSSAGQVTFVIQCQDTGLVYWNIGCIHLPNYLNRRFWDKFFGRISLRFDRLRTQLTRVSEYPTTFNLTGDGQIEMPMKVLGSRSEFEITLRLPYDDIGMRNNWNAIHTFLNRHLKPGDVVDLGTFERQLHRVYREMRSPSGINAAKIFVDGFKESFHNIFLEGRSMLLPGQ